MTKNKKIDLIHDNILTALLRFAIPIMITQIFQQLYNAADIAIVGNFLGANSLAAVASTAALFELIVGFILGIGNGMSIITAKYYGANNIEMVKKSAAHTILVGFILTLIVMMIGQLFLFPILNLLQTPQAIIHEAYSYISVIFLFIGVTFYYNVGAGLLRAIGNSFIPLIILVIASIINIVLDIVFITQFHLGIQGAAIATVIAQGFSAITCFLYIKYYEPDLLPNQSHFTIDKQLLKDLLGQGLSMGFVNSIVSIGTVTLQSAINQFGPEIIAAQSTARRVQFFLFMPNVSLAAALTTFVSQNYGAKLYHRIQTAIKYSIIISLIWGAFVWSILFFVAPYFITLLSGSTHPTLVNNARQYIAIATPFFGILGVLFCLRNALQGLGRKKEPLISSIIKFVLKLCFVTFFIPQFGYFAVMWTEPISWLLMTTQLGFSFYNNDIIKSLRHKK